MGGQQGKHINTVKTKSDKIKPAHGILKENKSSTALTGCIDLLKDYYHEFCIKRLLIDYIWLYRFFPAYIIVTYSVVIRVTPAKKFKEFTKFIVFEGILCHTK